MKKNHRRLQRKHSTELCAATCLHSGRWLSQAWHTSGLAGLAGETESREKGSGWLWMFILHFCIASVVKQVRKTLVFPALSDLWTGLSGHLLPSHYPTGTHTMAKLSTDWLIFFVPAAIQAARTQGSAETPVASQCNLGQSVYCTHVCLSSYVHLEHKGTSFVLWEPPPHIPACTSPHAAPSHMAQRSQESQPKISAVCSWLCPCCSVGC